MESLSALNKQLHSSSPWHSQISLGRRLLRFLLLWLTRRWCDWCSRCVKTRHLISVQVQHLPTDFSPLSAPCRPLQNQPWRHWKIARWILAPDWSTQNLPELWLVGNESDRGTAEVVQHLNGKKGREGPGGGEKSAGVLLAATNGAIVPAHQIMSQPALALQTTQEYKHGNIVFLFV